MKQAAPGLQAAAHETDPATETSPEPAQEGPIEAGDWIQVWPDVWGIDDGSARTFPNGEVRIHGVIARISIGRNESGDDSAFRDRIGDIVPGELEISDIEGGFVVRGDGGGDRFNRRDLLVSRRDGSTGIVCQGRYGSDHDEATLLQFCKSIRVASERPDVVDMTIASLGLVARVPSNTELTEDGTYATLSGLRFKVQLEAKHDGPAQAQDVANDMAQRSDGSGVKTKMLDAGFEILYHASPTINGSVDALMIGREIDGTQILCDAEELRWGDLWRAREVCMSLRSQ
ncbi:MAG: hypothetical protein K0V04_13650 [Deltaproteobacteria bacterium]|nr:hypothetical protein [Deltaproteobacteria bacterium]